LIRWFHFLIRWFHFLIRRFHYTCLKMTYARLAVPVITLLTINSAPPRCFKPSDPSKPVFPGLAPGTGPAQDNKNHTSKNTTRHPRPSQSVTRAGDRQAYPDVSSTLEGHPYGVVWMGRFLSNFGF
jgi:hypothetical protein